MDRHGQQPQPEHQWPVRVFAHESGTEVENALYFEDPISRCVSRVDLSRRVKKTEHRSFKMEHQFVSGCRDNSLLSDVTLVGVIPCGVVECQDQHNIAFSLAGPIEGEGLTLLDHLYFAGEFEIEVGHEFVSKHNLIFTKNGQVIEISLDVTRHDSVTAAIEGTIIKGTIIKDTIIKDILLLELLDSSHFDATTTKGQNNRQLLVQYFAQHALPIHNKHHDVSAMLNAYQTYAVGLYQDACDRDHEESCNKLAYYYASGTNVDVCVGRAKLLRERACKLGSATACGQIVQ